MKRSIVPTGLRYVDQVARSGSIQRAAKELNIAASAINRQVLALESDLGVTLFERVAKGMQLTSAGNAVVTLIRRWRSDERRMTGELRQLQGIDQGHVRLVAMDSHANGCLPRLIEGLGTLHPRITLDIRIEGTDEALAELLGEGADVIAAFNLAPHRALHVFWTRELPFGCVAAPDHPLAQSATVSLQEVVAHPLALQSKMLPIRRYLEDRHGWLFTRDQKMIETNSLQLVKVLARAGGHVAFTSELDAAPELLDGTLVFLPIRDKAAEPQSVSVAFDGRKPPSKIVKIVASELAAEMDRELEAVRGRRGAAAA